MSDIKKKYIGDNQVADEKIRLDNTQALRSRNSSDTGDLDLLKGTSGNKAAHGVDLEPDTDETLSLGSTVKKYLNMFSKAFELLGQGTIKFWDADNSNFVAFRAPTTVTADKTYNLPATDGSSGHVLTTDGSQNLSWQPQSGGANQTLSNLTSPTAINQNLIPGTNDTFDVGSASSRFLNSYVDTYLGRKLRQVPSGFGAINFELSDAKTMPSGATNFTAGQFQNNQKGGFFTSNGTTSTEFRIETGTASGGDSGGIYLRAGNATGQRGDVTLESTNVKINATNFTPVVDQSVSVGTSSLKFRYVYCRDVYTYTAGNADATWIRGTTTTTPSGTSVDGAIQKANNSTTDLAIYTNTAPYNVRIETANAPGATNSGDINLQTGTVVSGARGRVKVNARTFRLPLQSSAPTATEVGEQYYDSTTNKAYYWNGTAWIELGGGTGVGGISYLSEVDLDSLTNISSYDDGGAYVDGTGGSPTAITFAKNTTNPLDAAGDLKISKAASDGTGEGVTLLSDSVDIADRGRKLWVSFEWDGTHANYTSNDLKVHAYDVSNSTILAFIPVSGFLQDTTTGVATLPKIKTKVLGYIVPPSTCTQFRVSIHLTSDSATGSAWDVYVARPYASPQASVPGAIVSEPQIYTPTFGGFGTPTSVSVKWRRVGEFLHGYGSMVTGTVTATTASVSLPTGLTISSSSPAGITSSFYSVVGQVTGTGAGSAFWTLAKGGETAIYFSGGANGNTPQNATTLFASSQNVNFDFIVPIANWKSSAALTTTEIGLQTIQMKAYANAVAVTAGATITGWTETIDNWNAFNPSTGIWTAPKNCRVLVSFSQKYQTNANRAASIYVNGSPVSRSGGTNFGGYGGTTTALLSLSRGDQVIAVCLDNGGTTDPDAYSTIFQIAEVPDFTTFAAFKDNADVELYLDTGNGHGVTNTKIRRFSSVRKQTGSGVYYTYTDDANNGMSVTINVPGLYAVSYSDYYTAGVGELGVSLNSSALTTNISAVSYANGKRFFNNTPATGIAGAVSGTLRLAAGDVVRAHTNGAPNGTAGVEIFQLVRMGD